MKHLLIALALLPSTAALAENKFNLVCSGKQEMNVGLGIKEDRFSTTLVVDLESKKYCEDDCKYTLDISDVQPTAIFFIEENIGREKPGKMRLFKIDRQTGAYLNSIIESRGSAGFFTRTGTCSKAAFTGFPKHETKF